MRTTTPLPLTLKGLLLVASLGLGASAASGQVALTVANFDFETGGLADGFYSTGHNVPTSWIEYGGSGVIGGYFNPNTALGYAGTDGSSTIGTMSGPNVFYFGSARDNQGIEQTLSDNFAANTDYTLTVALGLRSSQSGTLAGTGSASPLRIELLAGSTVLGTNIVINTVQNTFSDFSLNYAANSSNDYLAGQLLTIRLTTFDVTDGDTDIDNVRLTATAVPEPGTYALIAGLVGLGFVTARRRLARV